MEINKKKIFKKLKKCCDSQKPLTGSEIRICLKTDLLAPKRKLDLTSASIIVLKEPPSLCWSLVVHLFTQSLCNILTSDPAELSNKKCTCVNKRCIRSKISWLWTGWIEWRCDAHWSRWMSNNYITQCYRKFELVGDQSLESVVAVRGVRTRSQQRLGPQGPRLSSPVGWEVSAAIARRAGGQYVAALFSLQLTSHT